MPRLGTRKLYYLLKEGFKNEGIKIGRDALFAYLKRENMLVRAQKKYVKTTFSKHWLRKHPTFIERIKDRKSRTGFRKRYNLC